MSQSCAIVFGAFTVDLPKQNRSFGKLPSLLFSDVLLIIGVGLALLAVLSLGIYVWMKFRRKRRRHVSGGEKVYRGSHGHATDAEETDVSDDSLEEEEEEEVNGESAEHHENGKRRYKYRVRRRTHRTRNPTLSETGGLPPVKTQDPSQPG